MPMQPDDERARRQELERRIHAKAIVDSPLWDEAYTKLIDDLLSMMLSPATSDENTLKLKREITALQSVRDYFGAVIQTGDFAQIQLENAEKERNGGTSTGG